VFFRLAAEMVSQRHHGMSASATAFAKSGHPGATEPAVCAGPGGQVQEPARPRLVGRPYAAIASGSDHAGCGTAGARGLSTARRRFGNRRCAASRNCFAVCPVRVPSSTHIVSMRYCEADRKRRGLWGVFQRTKERAAPIEADNVERVLANIDAHPPRGGSGELRLDGPGEPDRTKGWDESWCRHGGLA
jgi:hypothetical protein